MSPWHLLYLAPFAYVGFFLVYDELVAKLAGRVELPLWALFILRLPVLPGILVIAAWQQHVEQKQRKLLLEWVQSLADMRSEQDRAQDGTAP